MMKNDLNAAANDGVLIGLKKSFTCLLMKRGALEDTVMVDTECGFL